MISRDTAIKAGFALAVLSGCLFIFAALLTLPIITAILASYHATHWTPTPAFVTDVTLNQQPDGPQRLDTYDVHVQFFYEVQSRQYTGHGSYSELHDPEAHQTFVDLNHKQSEKLPITCYVNPENPENSILYQQRSSSFYKESAVAPLCMLLGAILPWIIFVLVLKKQGRPKYFRKVEQDGRYALQEVSKPDAVQMSSAAAISAPATKPDTVEVAFDLLGILSSLLLKIKRVWWLALLIAFVVLCILYRWLFALYFPNHNNWPTIAILCFCMLLPVATLFTLSYWIKELERLRSADSPRFTNGERVAVHGTWKSSGDTVRTPFTEQPCLFYEYRISHTPYNTTDPDTDFQGFSKKAPLTLQTASGDVRILNYVTPTEKFTVPVEQPEIAPKIDVFLKHTLFEKSWDAFMASKDGAHYCTEGAALGKERQVLEEEHVPVGAEVCIIGQWSASENGLTSEGIARRSYRVLKGNPRQATAPILRQIAKNIFIAIILAAFINLFAVIMLTSH